MKNKNWVAVSMLILELAGCGGGDASTGVGTGGGSAGGSTGGTTGGTTPGITSANLQQTVPTPTYAVNSFEFDSFSEVNGFRRMMGLGQVAQDVKLDLAAVNHGNYQALNQLFTHQEDSLKAGYTSVWPWDRQSFAGYAGTYSTEFFNGLQTGRDNVRGLMNTIYHRDGIADQKMTEIGLSHSTFVSINPDPAPPTTIDIFTLEGGYQGNGQNNASDFVTVYPVNKQIDLPLAFAPETPNPMPDISVNDFATKTSSPISIYSAKGTTLTVTTFTVTESGQTTALNSRIITKSNDVVAYVQSNVAHWVGSAPFESNTLYSVSFTGTVNGVAMARNWTFTTGTSLDIGGGVNM